MKLFSERVVLSEADKKAVDDCYRHFQEVAKSNPAVADYALEMCDAINGWLMKRAVDENGLPYAYCG